MEVVLKFIAKHIPLIYRRLDYCYIWFRCIYHTWSKWKSKPLRLSMFISCYITSITSPLYFHGNFFWGLSGDWLKALNFRSWKLFRLSIKFWMIVFKHIDVVKIFKNVLQELHISTFIYSNLTFEVRKVMAYLFIMECHSMICPSNHKPVSFQAVEVLQTLWITWWNYSRTYLN